MLIGDTTIHSTRVLGLLARGHCIHVVPSSVRSEIFESLSWYPGAVPKQKAFSVITPQFLVLLRFKVSRIAICAKCGQESLQGIQAADGEVSLKHRRSVAGLSIVKDIVVIPLLFECRTFPAHDHVFCRFSEG